MGKAVELLREIKDLLAKQQSPLLAADQAAAFLDISKSSLLRGEEEGLLPKAVQTPGGPRWRREELLKWIGTLKPRRKKPRRRIILAPDSPAPT